MIEDTNKKMVVPSLQVQEMDKNKNLTERQGKGFLAH